MSEFTPDKRFSVPNEINGSIWNKVCQSELIVGDLADGLKQVSGTGRGTFTSIDAYTQIKKATDMFGPMGMGWGVKDIDITFTVPMTKSTRKGIIEGTQLFFSMTFWYKWSGKIYEIPLMNDIFADHSGDTCKKVITDMITKSLSYLGWNYDVFCGRFNNVKTIQSKASQEEIDELMGLIITLKPEVANRTIKFHEKNGWLRDEVQLDTRKLAELKEAADRAKEATQVTEQTDEDKPSSDKTKAT